MFVIKSNNFVTVNDMYMFRRRDSYYGKEFSKLKKKKIAMMTYQMLNEVGAIDDGWKYENEQNGGKSLKLLLEAISL